MHGWVEIGDRCSSAAMRSIDQNIGVVLGGGEVLVIDTRSTHVQAREILADLRELTARSGDGRRRHARPLRPRLRQRRLPAGADLGPERCVTFMARTRRVATRADRPGTSRRSRPTCPRSSSTLRTGRSRDRETSMSAGAAVELRYLGRGHTDHEWSSACRARASCSPATCSRAARSLRSATAIRSIGRRRRYRVAELVQAVVVPGHGDHAGLASPTRRRRAIRARWRCWPGASMPAR